ncbi:MAG TPA: FliH/SctL family protein [Acidobacteriaceae bacterium]
MTERVVAPYEFRALTGDDMETMSATLELQDVRHIGNRSFASRGATDTSRGVGIGRGTGTWRDRAEWEATLAEAENTARQEGLEDGEKEGRRAARAEMEVEMRQSLARERERLAEAVKQFRETRDGYFAGVEQEVVKLALAIAARVLHREAQVDPLLLAGVVRVALEKMADRSGVVLRVCGADVEAWEGVFRATESSERPRVSEDARLERGECVLETSMGTVELGVSVQLEEIEKGFFDLLNHRPVE